MATLPEWKAPVKRGGECRVGVVKEKQSDGVEGKAVLNKATHLLFLRDSGITEV